MGIKERIIEAMGGVTEDTLNRRIAESAEWWYDDGGNDDPASGQIAQGGFGYRSIGSRGKRDLTAQRRADTTKAAWDLYQSNPVVKRYFEIKTGYVVGAGAEITHDDEAVQAVLDKFLTYNKIAKRLPRFSDALFLFGELFTPVFVRQSDGLVSIGQLDTSEISEVVCNPHNVLDTKAVVRSGAVDNSTVTSQVRVYRVADYDEYGRILAYAQRRGKELEAQGEIYDFERDILATYGASGYSGDVIYTAVNNIPTQPRGFSDLTQVADWLDSLNNVFWDLGTREQLAAYFVWEVIFKGSNPEDMAKRAKEIAGRTPRTGDMVMHLDGEEWKLITPNIGQSGTLNTIEEMITFILGGLGIPRHWYSDGGATNRSTADAQSDPVWRVLERSQSIIADYLKTLCDFAITQAVIAGTLPAMPDEPVQVKLPKMTTRNMAVIGNATTAIGNALAIAVEQGWVTSDTAAKVFGGAISELGHSVDSEQELRDLDDEAVDEVEQRGLEFQRLFEVYRAQAAE